MKKKTNINYPKEIGRYKTKGRWGEQKKKEKNKKKIRQKS